MKSTTVEKVVAASLAGAQLLLTACGGWLPQLTPDNADAGDLRKPGAAEEAGRTGGEKGHYQGHRPVTWDSFHADAHHQSGRVISNELLFDSI